MIVDWNDMAHTLLHAVTAGELVALAFSTPLVPFFCAVLVAEVLIALSWMRARRRPAEPLSSDAAASVERRYRPEQRVLAIGAIGVIFLFCADEVVRGYVLDLSLTIAWWRFVTPLAAAALALLPLLVVVRFRGTSAPQVPVLSPARRSWRSFGSRAGFLGGTAVLLALVATTILAGRASVANTQGDYAWVDIPVPNAPTEPLRHLFYGWAYGVPVLVALSVLMLVLWMLLRTNSVRPFLRPETVAQERRARGAIATGALRLVTASSLLALAGAWRLIADAGGSSGVTVIGADGREAFYDVAWSSAEIAAVGGALAPALELIAFVLLLFVIGQLQGISVPRRTSRVSLRGIEALQ